MQLLYVDESGDPGTTTGASEVFLLSGVVVSAKGWRKLLERYRAFRSAIRRDFGIPVYSEIHAGELVGSRGKVAGMSMKLKTRRSLFAQCLNFVSAQNDLELKVYSVVVDKRAARFRVPKTGIQDFAAKLLYQRFSNKLAKSNEDIRKRLVRAFPHVQRLDDDPRDEVIAALKSAGLYSYGVIFADETNEVSIRRVLRKMRVFNPIPNQVEFGPGYRNVPEPWTVEDPSIRNSKDSAFIQIADWVATALKCQENPSPYQKKTGLDEYYERLRPVLFTPACGHDPRNQGTYRHPRPK